MTEDELAARVQGDNGVTLSPDEARAIATLAQELNGRVAAAADARPAMEGAPWSFATLLVEFAGTGKARE
ncbi:hypothetical protein V5F49_08195 [Xanthobacter sp. V3C-3]|uniref:hypothetical protein n=1 Tax=Xanthobacter lutulentifluminis TaxID=3119935 RepID=UPI00372695E7